MSVVWKCNVCELNNQFERNTCQACFTHYPEHLKDRSTLNNNLGWIELSPAPKRWLSKPIMLNQSEFVVATEKLEISNNKEHEGIFSYNTFTNKWSMYFEYPNNVDLYVEYPTLFMDVDNNILYLHSNKGTLLMINTVNMSFDIKRLSGPHGGYARIFSYDNKFHLIGGHHNKRHCIWNDVKHKPLDYKPVHEFEWCIHGIFNPGFIHIKSQNMLLLFGGYDNERDYTLDSEPYKVYCYEYKVDRKWKQFKNMVMPYNMSLFGFAVTNDEKYVVISGGEVLETECLQFDIFIMDIEMGKIYKSETTCPELSAWHSIIMTRNPMDEILVNGYLRTINMPHDLCNIILSWYSSECLHSLKDHGHWKINVNYIHKAVGN